MSLTVHSCFHAPLMHKAFKRLLFVVVRGGTLLFNAKKSDQQSDQGKPTMKTYTRHTGIKSAFTDNTTRTKIKDTEATGLYLRINGNRAVFVYEYKIKGVKRLYTLPDIEIFSNSAPKDIGAALTQARAIHAGLRAQVRSGIDPAVEKNLKVQEIDAMPTVDEFAQTYWKRHASKKKSGDEDMRILNVDVIPFVGSLKLDKVTKRHINRLLDRKLDEGHDVAHNRLLSVLSKFFNVAIQRGEIKDNPTAKIPKKKENPRTRVMTDDEIRLLWTATGENSNLDTSTRLAVRLRLMTGQRSIEIVSTRTRDIKNGVWFMPETKKGNPHALPITDMMQSIFDEAMPHSRNGLLLPARNGSVMRVQVLSKIFDRIDWQLEEGQTRPTPHDLRRTFRTGLGELKFDNFLQRKVTNHTSNSRDENTIDRIYNGYEYMDEKRQALDAWNRKLSQILTGQGDSNVIPLHKTG
jgi:integrase